MTRLAAVAALAERSGPTLAQAGELVAEARHGALQAATAGCKMEIGKDGRRFFKITEARNSAAQIVGVVEVLFCFFLTKSVV